MSKYVVLAAIDLNPGSTPVFEHAILEASSRPNGEVHVLSVAEPQVPLLAYPGLVAPPELVGVDAEEVSEFCRDRLRFFRDNHPDVKLPQVHVHTSIGVPADEIVWFAAYLDAEWVVIGTHGKKHGLKRLLVGSVADKVMRLAGCPVMVIRDKNHNPEWKVPEIEPVCPACATMRQQSAGQSLWCERHSEHHVRGHIVSYSSAADVGPSTITNPIGI